ncbi:MAG: DUF2510 domain-containing protein [Microthrixaceae bacterium]
MERTFRGIHVDGDRIVYRDADHPLVGARASVKTPAALRRDVAAERLVVDEATLETTNVRRARQSVYLVITGEGFTMAVPVPVRKGSDARTFASRLNTAANRLALSSPELPESEVSTIGERYSVGTQVPPPKFDVTESTVVEHPSTSSGSSPVAAARSAARSTPAMAASTTTTGSGSAGWFSDPTGRYAHRYWDGQAWTEHVARNGVRGRDPVTGSGRTGLSGSSEAAETLSGVIASLFGVKPIR